MTGLEAVEKIEHLQSRKEALHRAIHFMAGRHDMSHEVRILTEMKEEVQKEINILKEKLRALRI